LAEGGFWKKKSHKDRGGKKNNTKDTHRRGCSSVLGVFMSTRYESEKGYEQDWGHHRGRNPGKPLLYEKKILWLKEISLKGRRSRDRGARKESA